MARSPEHITKTREAASLLGSGRLRDAERLARQVLKESPDDVGALSVLARVAAEVMLYDDAVRLFRRCITLAPEPDSHQRALGHILALKGELDEAERVFREQLERGDDALAASRLADVLEKKGRRDEAMGLIRYYTLAGLESALMGYVEVAVLVHQGKVEEAEDVARRTEQRWPDMERLYKQQMLLRLGRGLERRERYDDAFEAYDRGNKADPGGFVRAEFAADVRATRAQFTADVLRDLPVASDTSELPVFIAGMPRSGTTLVERIIGAHPQAHGAGELTHLPMLLEGHLRSLDGSPEHLRAALTQPVIEQIAGTYLAKLREYHPTATRIVDKNLATHRFLGVLPVLFPGARIINCTREPVNNCFAIFTAPLNASRIRYSTDLGDIGFVCRQQEALMDHWRQVCPQMSILQVRYEDMVNDQEAMSRQIIEFLGLPWDDRCLEYHRHETADKGKTASPTVSYEQVRKPIYSSSLDRAAHFHKHLQPLRDALAEPLED